MTLVSIVLPCLNEVRHGYLPRILDNLQHQPGPKQLIIVISPSRDATRQLIVSHPLGAAAELIETTAVNRAQRLNAGIQASQGEVVLLHHPATLLPENALEQVAAAANSGAQWGGFRHSFDLDHWLLRFTSWYSTHQRPRWGQVLYLDHCIFARRSVLAAVGGVPDMDIFEDTALSQALSRWGRPRMLPGTVITSARRFRERGVYRQAALNQLLKLMYYARLNPRTMNWLYERKSQINVTYDEAAYGESDDSSA